MACGFLGVVSALQDLLVSQHGQDALKWSMSAWQRRREGRGGHVYGRQVHVPVACMTKTLYS